MEKQKGVTLVELIIVIIILGILAAFIIPRLGSLETEARGSVVQAMAGSIRGAAAIAHGVSLTDPTKGAADPISLDGQAVTMTNHYPTADAAGILASLQETVSGTTIGGFNFTVDAVTSSITLAKAGATTPATCSVIYTNDGTNLSVVTDISGC